MLGDASRLMPDGWEVKSYDKLIFTLYVFFHIWVYLIMKIVYGYDRIVKCNAKTITF